MTCYKFNSTAVPITERENSFFPNGRRIGGMCNNVTIETYPYQISLEAYGRHNCGGSIISSNYVLTAGQCVGSGARALTVRAGTTFRGQGGSVHQVVKVIRHEKYYINTYGVPVNDIALLRVKEPFVFDETRQAVLLYESDEKVASGVKVVITGWGSTGYGTPSQLHSVVIPIITKDLCDLIYSNYGGIPHGQICAADYGEGGKHSCQNDAGDPFAINGRVAGIVSWGNVNSSAYFAGVYSEVAYFRDWINEHAQF